MSVPKEKSVAVAERLTRRTVHTIANLYKLGTNICLHSTSYREDLVTHLTQNWCTSKKCPTAIMSIHEEKSLWYNGTINVYIVHALVSIRPSSLIRLGCSLPHKPHYKTLTLEFPLRLPRDTAPEDQQTSLGRQ